MERIEIEDKELIKTMGKRMRLMRIEKEWTQAELAEKVGLTQGSITFYETGQRAIQFHIAIKMANLFGVSLDYLLGVSDVKDTLALEDFNDPDLRYLARNIKDRKEAEKIRKVAEALFPDSFKR